MVKINPYLNFLGNTEEAFNFYKSVFGGEFKLLQRFKDTPEAGKVPEQDLEKIMHVALPIGNGSLLMGTDALESVGHIIKMGDNISLSIDTESEIEAKDIFNKLSVDGKITMPLDKMFWGAYFGMLVDKFGIQWMVNFDENQPK